MESQLVQNVADLHTGRALSNDQPIGDLTIRQPLCNEPRDLPLPWTQHPQWPEVGRKSTSGRASPSFWQIPRPGETGYLRPDPLDDGGAFCVGNNDGDVRGQRPLANGTDEILRWPCLLKLCHFG